MRKVQLLLVLLFCSLLIYAQNPNAGQILDGSEPFTLKFNFAHIVDKTTGQQTNLNANATLKFTPGKIKGQGTILLIFDDEVVEGNIYEIQPIMVEGIMHYAGFQKENGITVSVLTWSTIALHVVDSVYTISYGIKTKKYADL